MDLRQIYGDIALQLRAKNVIGTSLYTDRDERIIFEKIVSSLFSKTVKLEKAINTDDIKVIQSSLASLAAITLEILDYWTNSDWCIRTPNKVHNRFATAADLTAPLRMIIEDVIYYKDINAKDVYISLEILLKKCIELSKTLDFDLAMALFEHLRK